MVVVSHHLEGGKWVKRCRDSRGGGGALAGFHGLSGDVGWFGELLKSFPKFLDGCGEVGRCVVVPWWC